MKKKKYINNLLVLLILVLALPVSVFLINKKTNFFNKAYVRITGSPANIVVNMSSGAVFTPHWINFAQGGEEKDGMLSAVTNQVSALKPGYIRLDHIFDFYGTVKRGPGNSIVFDWMALDKELGEITKTGAKPFISLSYMPQVISSGTEVDVPYSWDEWKYVVQKSVEHISGQRGLAISNVYYEVWNEPELFGGFKLRGTKNYLTMYLYAEQGVKEAKEVMPFKFGGPASAVLSKTWFDGLLYYVEKNNLRMDFYSWHRYSLNVNDFVTDIANVNKWLLDHPKYTSTELIITESGHNSEIDLGYDNDFSAIHTLAMYAATFQKIGKIFVFELKDGPGPEKLWGRWGLLTNENFGTPLAKPRYHAIKLLNLMQGRWYPLYGQGTWVKAMATTDGMVARVLLVNFNPYYQYSENVQLKLIDLKQGDYVLRRTDIKGIVSESSITVADKSWASDIKMQPNSAFVLEFLPK